MNQLSGTTGISDSFCAKHEREAGEPFDPTDAEDVSYLDQLMLREAEESKSDRELEVFSLLGQGRGTRQIAEQLYVSVKTVETYRLRIKEKLHIDTGSELLHHAFQWVNEQDKCHSA